jgi:hypothetical protein
MASCDSKTYTNIRDLPQTFNVTSGDYLIVENPQGTNIIDYKDIIISLDQTTFASNLSTLELNVASLSAELKIVSNAALPSIMNVRMSLSVDSPTPTTSLTGTNANTLYIHPFKGDTVTLYDTALSAWKAYTFNSKIGISLANTDFCDIANTCYDIYLGIKNGAFEVSSRSWTDQNLGSNNFTAATETSYMDGVELHPTDKNKRLIGCIRTTTAGRSEYNFGTTAAIGVSGTHPKFYVWNMYNRQPVSFSIIDNRGADQGWTTTTLGQNAGLGGPFERFGGTSDNKVSFIARESIIVNFSSIYYVGIVGSPQPYYLTYSLNLETPTVSQILSNSPGVPIFQETAGSTMSQSANFRILPGYNYIQLVSMTSSDQNVRYWTWGGNRNSYGTTGIIQNI